MFANLLMSIIVYSVRTTVLIIGSADRTIFNIILLIIIVIRLNKITSAKNVFKQINDNKISKHGGFALTE